MHGGWFDAGNLETHDTPLRQLASLSQTVIISIDYRPYWNGYKYRFNRS